jgi:hypothetical protein
MVLSGINLPNEGGELVLLNAHGAVIHAASYTVPWNGPGWKQEGGWSLESPDPDRICGISALWGYSVNPSGGTPGSINSLNERKTDRDPPLFLYTGFRDNRTVLSLYFSETVRHSRWIPSHFPIAPGDMVPVQVSASFPFSDRIDLRLPGGAADQNELRVTLPLLTDCTGNICRAGEARAGCPGNPVYGSLKISEVMFAPRDGAPEYIELYNPGPGYYDLMDLCVNAGEEEGFVEHPVPVSSHSRLMVPGTYLVLTPNVDHLMAAYGLEAGGRWVGMGDWIALRNTGGFLSLTDRSGGMVDMVPYGDHLHMELMGDTRGVSLERIDFGTSGNDPENWHSAASIAGYATPGEPNSQQAGMVIPDGILQVSPKVFSPDNDGFEDLLEITVSPGGHGWAIHLVVTDLAGRRIRVLANNDLSGPVSMYRWDGESDAGRMVPEGIYILHAWGYHDSSGKVWRHRESLGVVYR